MAKSCLDTLPRVKYNAYADALQLQPLPHGWSKNVVFIKHRACWGKPVEAGRSPGPRPWPLNLTGSGVY